MSFTKLVSISLSKLTPLVVAIANIYQQKMK